MMNCMLTPDALCREGVHLRHEQAAEVKGRGKPKDLSKKAILLSGPPGIGKTSSASIISRYNADSAVEALAALLPVSVACSLCLHRGLPCWMQQWSACMHEQAGTNLGLLVWPVFTMHSTEYHDIAQHRTAQHCIAQPGSA